jgi:integrase
MPRTRGNGQGGLIQYKNSARWYAQYYDASGKQHRKSTGKTIKAEAESVLRGWMTDSSRGLKPSPETRNVTYDNLRDALLESYRVKGNKSLRVYADGREGLFPLGALNEHFAGKRAATIDPDAIRGFIRKRQKDGVGNAAINNSLSLLRRMFSIARREGKLQSVPHVELLKAPPARTGFLKPKDFKKLRHKLPRHLRPLVTFLYFCGVRVGEARQVQWSAVDLKKALIVLREGETKSGEQRIVPIPKALVTMLRATKKKEGLVFDSTNLRKEWDAATAACGLGNLIVHDLRRSAIRNMMLSGAQQVEAMKISGHRTASVFQRYNIIDEAQTISVMKRVESFCG